jgi:DNA repair exonuclease SbcCD ATPase subunit
MRMNILKLAVPIVAIMFLASCNNHEEELKQMQQKQDSLLQVLNEKDSVVDEFFSAFSDIQENLNTIKEKEHIIDISSTNAENSPEAKDQINKDIQTIYDLLQENKAKLKKLEKRLRGAGLKIKSLKKIIAKLEEQIAAKDTEIAGLKAKLESMNIQITALENNVDSLSIENAKKEEVINTQDTELHKAYYVIGNKKELLENGIITRTGGFVGIGRISKLREDFNKDYFTTIDIRDVKEITIASKKAELVTTHPEGSYEFVKNENGKLVEKLVIKDPEKFWSVSKYLVIMVE